MSAPPFDFPIPGGPGFPSDVMRAMLNFLITGELGEEDNARVMELWQEAVHSGLASPGEITAVSPEEAARALAGVMLAKDTAPQANLRLLDTGPRDPATISREVAGNEVLLGLLERSRVRGLVPGMLDTFAQLLHANCAMGLFELAEATQPSPDLDARINAHLDQVSDDFVRQFPAVGASKAALQVFAGTRDIGDEAVAAAADQLRDSWDQQGAEVVRAEAAARHASSTGDPADVDAAIAGLQVAWIGLPVSSRRRGQVLNALADLLFGRALTTGDLATLHGALSTAIAALHAASTPRMAQHAAIIVTSCLIWMVVTGEIRGPFADAERELRGALARTAPADPAERAALLTALCAAVGMRAATAGDESLRVAARQLTEEAGQTLPAAVPAADVWQAGSDLYYRTVEALHWWAALQVLNRGDAAMTGVALRINATYGRCLADGPAGPAMTVERERVAQAREQLIEAERWARDGGSLDPEPALRESLGPARPGAADRAEVLRQALAVALDDTRSRHDAHRRLGQHLAEAYWADPAARTARTLDEAIEHLNQALVTGDYTLPTADRAGLLYALARCYREAGRTGGEAAMRRRADQAARAALRELTGCVLITGSAVQALAIGAQANEIAATAVGWCLADGRERAAISIAESGRGRVLASALLTGQVEELLRGAGEQAAADAWAAGGEAGKATALDTLLDIRTGVVLLSAPTEVGVSLSVMTTPLDAVVYLVPPDERGAAWQDAPLSGYAILVRPELTRVEVLALPGLTTLQATPLAAYLDALRDALAVHSPGAGGTAGFRGLARGTAWASALDALGQWAYDTIMGPLIAHARGWGRSHLPRLALIPLGQLGAIPFAAAWRPTAPGGTRRYAIEDVVLSYTASGRLLGEVSNRPRQRLDEQVVFVADPTGQFHFSRRVLPGLASELYPRARVYGMKAAQDGPATTAVVLDALPGGAGHGASLLHLTTHGMLDPEPAVQTRDGLLPLARVLRQARDRASDAPGGLVITNACLTDVTLANFDESLTLATAFLAAGATSVIGTRWPVDDDTTSALTVQLHRYLKSGATPAEALRRAQLDLLRPGPALRESLGPAFDAIDDARLSHPASWAGHVHHGI